mmetsp:Transcript_23111/g.54639  ORF Transcript_23111/g.54639 Transcript_23111/m.54639 type:complete len:271 (+) Transcript_23111:486-1298(+)
MVMAAMVFAVLVFTIVVVFTVVVLIFTVVVLTLVVDVFLGGDRLRRHLRDFLGHRRHRHRRRRLQIGEERHHALPRSGIRHGVVGVGPPAGEAVRGVGVPSDLPGGAGSVQVELQLGGVAVGVVDAARQDEHVGEDLVRLNGPEGVQPPVDGNDGADGFQGARRERVIEGSRSAQAVPGDVDVVGVDHGVGPEDIEGRLDAAHEKRGIATVLGGQLDAHRKVLDVGVILPVDVGDHGDHAGFFRGQGGALRLVSRRSVDAVPVGKDQQAG